MTTSSFSFLNYFLDLFAQLLGVNASNVLVNHLALFVVEKSCGQAALPSRIHKIDGGLRIRNVQQVSRHRRLHRTEKLRHLGFDVTHIVERDR